MNRSSLCLATILLALGISIRAQDYPGYKDPALFSRIPGYFLDMSESVQEKAFDAFDFRIAAGGKTEMKHIEGRFASYWYRHQKRTPPVPVASILQIIRNYQNAAAKIGGKVMYEDRYRTTIRIASAGRETWVEVADKYYGEQYTVTIVEQEAMQQQVSADAAALRSVLQESGHAEVPGILFDFGRAEVKPESEPALKEIVKLMQGNTALKVWVVGHTDSVGVAEANLKLSSERAASVVRVLTQKMGIDPKRLASFGAGPYAPVSSNATEEGRARNRRVELVVQ